MDLRSFICFIFLASVRISRGQIVGCPKGQWQCDDTSCITDAWRCDGEGDCLDGSDEMDCGAPASSDCPSGQFPCLDSVGCVDASARCDGKIQCPTGSDEENCPVTEGCQDSDWMCKNHICILKELRCNKQNDCVDNSDEDDCDLCSKNGVRCPEGTCLSAKERCDGQIHCSDGSDEPITCGRLCSMNNGGCSHTCTDEPWGVLCTCPVGYKLAPNGAVCEDVNECESPFAPCLHHCTNTIGSYYCHCKEGFILDGSSTCLASGNATRLLMVQRSTVGLLSVKSQQFDSIATSVFDPVALAFDIARGWLYWADSQGNIYKSNGRYSWTAYAGEPGIGSLACDWLNGYLFWTNQKTESIYMQTDDGKGYTTLLHKDIRPSELVLLPVESIMFWINEGSGDRMTIEKSWMDGSDRSTLTVITAQSAHSLTADVAARRLYWISDFKTSVETVKVDGTGRYSFTGLFSKRPALSLAVFESMFYWIDYKGLWQAPQNNPTQRKFIWKTELPLLAVYHELQQPQGSSACLKSPCSFCQLTKSDPAGFTCACPLFKVLMPDGTCRYPRFVYATTSTVNLLEFRRKESTEIQLFATEDGILSFDLDWTRDWLYWTNQTGHIQRTSLTQVKTEVIPTPLPVCLINVDQRSGNLFWVTCDENSIGTTTVGNNYPQRLYHTTKEIRSLYLDWLRGGVFWLEEEQIFSMDMLGGKATELLQIAGGVRGNMAFDIRASSLLWNSRRGGLTTLSLLQERSHQAGKRWNISGSIVAALEPYLLSVSDDVMTLWDRRDGSPIQDATLRGRPVCVISALGDVQTVPDTPVCSLPSLLCRHSSLCLPQAQLCDGKKDCPDGDDEESCVVSCPSKEDFKCKDHSSCIPRSLLCDGRSHCRDGSDEVNCPTFASPVIQQNLLKCRSGSKPCADGSECVLYIHVCDGEEDCGDGSDELGCDVPQESSSTKQNVDPSNEMPPARASQKGNVKCRFGSRPCQDGTACVLLSHVCDGETDCQDGSDEEGCDAAESTPNVPVKNEQLSQSANIQPFTPPPTKPLCTSPSVQCPGSSLCIKPTQMCDGRRDCPDGSDEKCVKRCPSKTDFRCKDRRSCIPKSQVCDGRSHCNDGSDEVGCSSAALSTTPPSVLKCRFGSRPCQDGTACVLLSHVCDGEADCRDGSDEEGCDVIESTPNAPVKNELTQSPAPVEAFTPPPTKPPCTSPSVQCPGSSLCIKPAQMCDGRRDCPDGFDEICVKRCPSNSDFRCKDRRRCVSKSQVCDGRSDCHDGSDEVGCPSVAASFPQKEKVKCRFGSRLCQDGTECILLSHVCDGERDCQDGSDEEGCEGAKIVPTISAEQEHESPANIQPFTPPPTKPPCTSPSVQCPDSSLCIKATQMCDGRRDCPDGSDEICVKRCPSDTDFRCKDRRRCVSKSQVCDGRSDCHDGSDEVGCPSVAARAPQKERVKCRFGSTLCQDGTECILLSHVCDGERDCQDGSDEEGCDGAKIVPTISAENENMNESPALVQPFTPPPTKPPCTSPSVQCPGSSLCIKPTQMCDGRRDCPDGSDEKCVKRCPSKTDFRCKDRRSCVSKSQVCDGRSDCHDSSDEVGCSSVPLSEAPAKVLKCLMGSWSCQDGTECIVFSHVCDGETDCRDGSDEEGCDAAEMTKGPSSSNEPSCSFPSVQCPESDVCVIPTQFCDGKRDCPDGSDENCLKKCFDKTEFLCKDRRRCISKNLVCDGRSHCNDGSDEVNCPSVTAPAPQADVLKCRMGSKPCNDGKECVLYSHVCDGEKDCLDGSDEEGCQEICKQGEFQCAHGKMCIPEAEVCDGKYQCRDRSDELDCWEQTKSCEYRCADGKRCIPTKFLCDGERDCMDGTDELGCDSNPAAMESPLSPPTPACVTPSVLCPGSSLCVSQNQLCDGQKDCPDGYDENSCVIQCENPEDFLCNDKRKCVPSIHVCDGRAHCPDGSDEKQCQSSATSTSNVPNASSGPLRCLKGFKPCKDGLECVMYSHVCDGEKDCKDGSDEEECRSLCKAGEFQCAHGNRCILRELVCDGQNDCQDRSDEMDCLSQSEGCHQRCDNNTRCIPKTFLCDGERDCVDGSDEEKCGLVACGFHQYRCASGQCVSEALRCDGYPDCSDRSDEVDCRRPPRCPSQLKCPHSHECLQKDWICDGEEDCEDGSDEKNCITPLVTCGAYQWQCGEGRWCIPLSWRCDGKEDCHDGKDEYKCSQRKCPSHLYQCSSGECLDPSLVCNGRINCADGSDEGVGCAQRNCSSPSAPQCDHHCVSTPKGPRCYCTPGLEPQPITQSCVDIDECNSAPDPVCKHLCLNTPGSYSCRCHTGFYLEPDNKSCKTIDEPLLLASVQSDLLLLRVHSGTVDLFASTDRPVSSLDYYWAQKRVYWLSTNSQSIRWADMSNSNKGTLIKGVKCNSIAVDWVGGNIYWLDGQAGQILAARLDNVMVKSDAYTVVLGENLQQPNSLVLVPDRGLMLWSEIGSTPQIERSGMDGSKRKVVVSQDLSWPVSLAYDLLDNRVYWADEKLHCIGSASLDGNDIKILQLAETPSPVSVAVFNDRVFWSDSKRRTIRSADKKTGKNQRVLLKRPGQPFELKLIHALSQPEVSSLCGKLRCSHLCLLAPRDGGKSGAGSPEAPAAVCRCPMGLLLSPDKITCSLPKESSFIFLLSHNMVYQIYLRSMSRDGFNLEKMPNGRDFALPGSEEPLGLDLSIPELSLFVADSRRGSVDMLRLSSSGSQPGLALAGQILKLKDDSVTALAVDWVTTNLYWSSNKRPDIHVTSRYNGHTTSLEQGSLTETTSIALHPPSGRLCYIAVVMTGSNSQTVVHCAWMNGWYKVVVWKKSSVPVSLVFSNTGTVIYWADTAEGVIASVGVDGSGYKQFKTGPSLLVSLAYIESIFLWTTRDKDSTKLWFSDGVQPKQLWFETKIGVLDIRAYNDDSQSGTNSCSKNNGECDQLCLPYPEDRTCRCGRGFHIINATSCVPLPSCPPGEESCYDGNHCITSTKFCDGRTDCADHSDEQDCPNSNSASPRTKFSDGRSPQSPSSPHPNNQKNSVVSDKNSASCDSNHCSGHGACITEGQLTRCQCVAGYKGEFCNEQDRKSHPAVILGSFSLVAGVILAAFVLCRRKGWTHFRSKSPDKETLMGNMVLPGEQDSDSEELESSVDVRSPLRYKAIKPLQFK